MDWYDEDRRDRVLRGGSWFDGGQYCRSSVRNWGDEPSSRGRCYGLRLAAVPRAQERPESVEADESTSRAEHDSESDEVKRD